MNKVAKHLNQTLYNIASTILKESNLPIKYWSELILIFNYLRNQLSVIGYAIIPYEVCTKYKPYFQYLDQIGQSRFTQNRKPYTR